MQTLKAFQNSSPVLLTKHAAHPATKHTDIWFILLFYVERFVSYLEIILWLKVRRQVSCSFLVFPRLISRCHLISYILISKINLTNTADEGKALKNDHGKRAALRKDERKLERNEGFGGIIPLCFVSSGWINTGCTHTHRVTDDPSW